MRVPGLEIDAATEALPWRATSSPGISWYLLASDGRDAGAEAGTGASVLIRMAPGRGYPPHRHLDVEEVLILRGGYRDATGEHLAGSYLRYPAGSVHSPVALGDPERPEGPDNPACILYASARGGIELLDGRGGALGPGPRVE